MGSLVRTTKAGASLLTALALVLVGCPAEDAPPTPDATPAPDPSPTSPADEAITEPTDDPYAAVADAVAAVGTQGLAHTLASGLATTDEVSGDVNADAALLRAELALNLRDHAHLTVRVTEAERAFGPGTPWADAAHGTLEENVRSLAHILGPVAGSSLAVEVEGAWSAYTDAMLDGEEAGGAAADQVAEAMEAATDGDLGGDELETLLDEHARRLGGAVRAATEGDPGAYQAAREAASTAARLASRFAAGLVDAHEVEGDPDSAGAALHAELATLLVDDAHLTARAALVIHERGAGDERYAAATEALDATAARLAKTLDGVAAGTGADVLERWRIGIGLWVDLARAHTAGDERLIGETVEALRGEADGLAEALAVPGVSADELRGPLEERMVTLERSIRTITADR